MNKNDFKTIFQLAKIAMENKDGFTVSRDLKVITAGFAVAVIGTQNSFGINGLANVVNYVNDHQEINAFGGWYDSETDQYYFDATIVVDSLEKAVELGNLNQQKAIFNLNKMEEIRL